ncbi:MAG: RNA-binding domain-containing protein [Candidatus Nitrosotenuis sp.]
MEKRLEVDIQVIVHATEDPQKIFDAFKETFGVDKEDFAVQSLKGHFENPIMLLRAKLKKKKAKSFVVALISSIPKAEIDSIVGDLESRCDDSALFLRISKQSLVQNKVALSDNDPVRLRIFSPIYSQRDVVKTYSEILNGTI